MLRANLRLGKVGAILTEPNPSFGRFVFLMVVGVISIVAGSVVAFAGEQSSSQTAIQGVFESDLADVTPAGLAALKEAAEKAKMHAGCYPPRVTFTAQSPGSGDPSFDKALATTRGDALKAALPSLGLDADQVRADSAVAGSDDVAVSSEPFNQGGDKVPPILKVASTPAKYSKVKSGDTISVTVVASEKYSAGHSNWPTGVQSIQLLADDGLVDSKDYGKPPKPCEVETFTATYRVPANPPAIVHLRVLVQDGVGNEATKTADFPTGDLWEGTWKLSYRKHIDGGEFPWEFIHIEDDLSARFNFVVANDGSVEGWASAAVVAYHINDDGCGYVSNSVCGGRCKGDADLDPTTVELKITGHRTGNSFRLDLTPVQPDPAMIKTSVCEYPAGTTTIKSPPIYWFCSTDPSRLCSGSSRFLHVDIPAEDGASMPISYSEVGGGENGSVTIRRVLN